MLYRKIVFFILLLGCCASALQAQKILNPILIQREGLPNLAAKLKSKPTDSLIIAFIGGSITEAQNGYRDQTIAWLQQKYPQKIIKQINAGIGGTGSSLGVYRTKEQVLKHNPDLVFIEFAVNDYKETRKSILESMEGMVRQVWLQNPQTDICFIYTFTKDMIESYQKGFAPYSLLTMEEIANHYQIPSINFAPDILKRLNNKELFPIGNNAMGKDSVFFSGDGVHPYPETGHKYYAETAAGCLTALLNTSKNKIKHHLLSVYFSDALVNARMIDVDDRMLINPMVNNYKTIVENRKTYKRLLPNLQVLSSEKSVLNFKFSGNKIGFLDVIGPSSTQLKVEIDQDAPRYITRFDKFGTFTRMHWFFIENLSDGEHQIKITIVPQRIDKFEIIGKNPSELKNIKDYQQEFWQVGKILLVNAASKI